ncbi:MAG: ATP-binding protein [Planctomycetota bacterium]
MILPIEIRELPQKLQEPYIRILEILCSDTGFEEAARLLLGEISKATGCEATALRVYDGKADYPYYIYKGFDDSFAKKENYLCEQDDEGNIARDNIGIARLECMCGLVIRGHTNPEFPFFTENGSFWTNSTTDLLAGEEKAEFSITTRNICNAFGYESVALAPLRAGDRIIGLVQANSRERDCFNPVVIDFLERIGLYAGLAIEAAWKRRELAGLWKEFEDRRKGVETMIAIGEIAATLAHELKNPLAGMMMSAGRLRKALKELEGQEKLLSIADHLVDATSTLTETVSRVARTDHTPRLEAQYVSVNNVLESAVNLIATKAAIHKIQIIYDLQVDLPQIKGDANFLMRAFLNLLSNALEAMPSIGIIRLSTRLVGDDKVEAVISDTGPGIDPEKVDSLFLPFATTKESGTGLGLAVVKRIVEMHGGAVELRRGREGGAEAVIRLPRDGGGGKISDRLGIV